MDITLTNPIPVPTSMLGDSNFKILLPKIALEEIITRIDLAKKVIMWQIMQVHPDNYTDMIMQHLFLAARRGVKVYLKFDYNTLLTNAGTPWWIDATKRGEIAVRDKTHMIFDLLNEPNVELVITNPPTRLENFVVVRHRNHSKVIVIDDVGYFTGANMSKGNFERGDHFVRITDPDIVEQMTNFFRTTYTQNAELECTPETKILVDAGIGSSIILDSFMQELENKPKQVLMYAHFPLDGILAQRLSGLVKDGCDVHVISSEFSSIKEPLSKVFEVSKRAVLKFKGYTNIPMHDSHIWIHNKMVIVIHADGSVWVETGSHNHNTFGSYTMRAAEVAIATTNQDFGREVMAFWDYSLKATHPRINLI